MIPSIIERSHETIIYYQDVFMNKKKRILILTSKTGGGHVSLAEALRDQLEQDYTIEIIDPQPAFFLLHYRLVSRYALWLWSAEFRMSDTPRQALTMHRIFARLVKKSLTATLRRVQPDLIISTYPFLTYEVTQVLARQIDAPPFAMLFSDPNGVHASWLTERDAAATFATSRETYAQALATGFDPARLHLTGWPVRAQFYRATQLARADTLLRLGLHPDRFTIFLQGGGEGAAQFGRTVERVLGIGKPLQVILATGTNAALLARFKNTPNLHALPFTREIAPLMAAADVIMGKAGPNMLMEAVTLGKPFIATAYIPGQEEANLEFIRRHKLGWIALTAHEQEAIIEELATSHSTLEEMTKSVASYRQWNTEVTASIPGLVATLLNDNMVITPDIR